MYKSGAESRPKIYDSLCVGEAEMLEGVLFFVHVVLQNLVFLAFLKCFIVCLLLQHSSNNKNAIVSLTKKPVCVGHLFPAREASDSDAV